MKYSTEMETVWQPAAAKELADRPETFVAQVEEKFRAKLEEACELVLTKQTPIILITGPSASGKTTTAKHLSNALRARGKKVNRISLDDFYYPKEQLPFWEDGYQNYESIEGLDIPCFERVMNELLQNKTAAFPIFDFRTGIRAEKTYTLTFDESTYLIIEGIHALNPRLYETLHGYPALKIYISVHSNFVDQNGEMLLSARDLRLSRRLLRDYHYRGTPGQGTLEMWYYVLKGEDLYIRPFRTHADLHINSTHDYEPFLYHRGFAAMLREIPSDSSYYDICQRLLQVNESFFGIPYSLVPPTSLIQEFILSNHLQQNKIHVEGSH